MENIKPVKKVNGIEVYNLSDFVDHNFDEVEKMFNYATVTQNIDPYDAYSNRIKNNFVGVYKVKISRDEDYERFIEKLDYDRQHILKDYQLKVAKIYDRYSNGEITYAEKENLVEELYRKSREIEKTCKCKLCTLHVSYEEWRDNKYNLPDGRKIKLGKYLKKIGISQEVLDFYSLQIKKEQTVYLTISDYPQHIAGMSFYAKARSWEQYNGTSCQDPRHDGKEVIHLAGALHDNKLFIGMLHYDLNDLYDMKDKLQARTLFRLIHINGEPVLVSSRYYGNQKTMNELKTALYKLRVFNIFPNDYTILEDEYSMSDGEWIEEPANGKYSFTITDEVHIDETYSDYVDVDCPACNGTGTIYVDTEYGEQTIDCPACWYGTVEQYVSVSIDEYVDVDIDVEVTPYNEWYSHEGSYISIKVDKEGILKQLEKNKEKVIQD